ncbi:hypothetical protein BB8028_0007g01410 [Beauveria bassiana]|uniref:Uncharacterized protein n=1 Tax=Beauveria bassiana TaxID=176275 RepID=A0A2S7YL77_BEABA|nr:hypothetical protein BB8028_0007g01410 [Beauveria bassiana]
MSLLGSQQSKHGQNHRAPPASLPVGAHPLAPRGARRALRPQALPARAAPRPRRLQGAAPLGCRPRYPRRLQRPDPRRVGRLRRIPRAPARCRPSLCRALGARLRRLLVLVALEQRHLSARRLPRHVCPRRRRRRRQQDADRLQGEARARPQGPGRAAEQERLHCGARADGRGHYDGVFADDDASLFAVQLGRVPEYSKVPGTHRQKRGVPHGHGQIRPGYEAGAWCRVAQVIVVDVEYIERIRSLFKQPKTS